MAISKDDGGPAFSQAVPDGGLRGEPGMSLRDYFAAKAMQGIVTCGSVVIRREGFSLESDVACAAYKTADAMLAERKKGG